MERVYLTGTDSVMIQLQFDPLVTGKIVTVTAAPGVIIEPLQTAVLIRPTGDCAVTVRLGDGFAHGHVSFSCEGLQTILPLQRSSLAVVSAKQTEGPR